MASRANSRQSFDNSTGGQGETEKQQIKRKDTGYPVVQDDQNTSDVKTDRRSSSDQNAGQTPARQASRQSVGNSEQANAQKVEEEVRETERRYSRQSISGQEQGAGNDANQDQTGSQSRKASTTSIGQGADRRGSGATEPRKNSAASVTSGQARRESNTSTVQEVTESKTVEQTESETGPNDGETVSAKRQSIKTKSSSSDLKA